MNQAGHTVIGSLVLMLVLALGVGSCGSGSSPDADADAASGSPGSGPPKRSVIPGASGEVAALSGKTMQVQSPLGGQVAVTWTAETTFTHQVEASLSDLEVGDCVLVTTDGAGRSNGPASEVDAATVRISAPVDGSCEPVAAGSIAPPGEPAGADDLTTEMPSDLPSDGLSLAGPGGPGGGVFGTVTATKSAGFTVESTVPEPPGAPGSGDSDSTTETDTVSVAVSAGTVFTTTGKTTSKAVRVGSCVDARGDSDSTGAVTADTVNVTPKVKGRCGPAFGNLTDERN